VAWHLQSVGDKQADIRQCEDGIERCDADNTELNKERNELQNKLKELQRTEASVKR
jgi:prefoldin subunit 5